MIKPSYRCMLIYSSPSVCPPACLTVVCFLVLSGPTGKRVYLLPPPLSLSLCPVFSLVICLSTPLVMSPTLSLPLFFLGGFSQGGVASGRAGLQKAISIFSRCYLHSDNDERIWCSCKVSDRMCRGSCRAQNNKKTVCEPCNHLQGSFSIPVVACPFPG